MAEILKSFPEHVESFELEPGDGGEFEFSIDDELVYSKKETKEFPTAAQLTEAVYSAVNARG